MQDTQTLCAPAVDSKNKPVIWELLIFPPVHTSNGPLDQFQHQAQSYMVHFICYLGVVESVDLRDEHLGIASPALLLQVLMLVHAPIPMYGYGTAAHEVDAPGW